MQSRHYLITDLHLHQLQRLHIYRCECIFTHSKFQNSLQLTDFYFK